MQVNADEKLISLASAEYPPYYGEQLKNYGPVTQIIVEAYEEVGYDVDVKFFPWVRGENMAKEGKYDGMFPPWHTKEREDYFVFSDPLFPNNIHFYKLKKTKVAFSSYEDLKGYKIGVVRGYANPAVLAEVDLQFEEVSKDLQNLLKLAAGRIDLTLMDSKLAEFLIRSELPEYTDAFARIDPAVESRMQYLCISRKAVDYQTKLEDFNRGLKLLRESGEYEEILLEHGL
jgi:polar amino acid transport system substrate-binding protein